jgi:hypothetical protein
MQVKRFKSGPWTWVLPYTLLLIILVLNGCAGGPLTTREKGAGIGVLGGAVAGGLIGGSVGHPGAGAAIGGLLGLGAGAVIGDQLQGHEQKQNQQELDYERNRQELERQKQEIECMKRYGPKRCRN